MVFKWAIFQQPRFDDQKVPETMAFYPPIVRVFPWTNPGNHVMMWKIPMFDLNGWMRTPNMFQQKCGNTVDGDGELHRFGRNIQHFLFLDVYMGPLFHYTLQYMIIHFGQFGFSASNWISWIILAYKHYSLEIPHLATDFFSCGVRSSCETVFFWFLIGYTSETLREV